MVRKQFIIVLLLTALLASVACAKPISINPHDLYFAYVQHELRADNEYRDKVLEVTGKVAMMGRDSVGGAYLIMIGKTSSGHGIQFNFSKRNESQLANVSVGNEITIRGKCKGLSWGIDILGMTIGGHVILENSSVVES